MKDRQWKTGGIRCALRWPILKSLDTNNTFIPGGLKASGLESVKCQLQDTFSLTLIMVYSQLLCTMDTNRGVENPEALPWSLALSYVLPAATTYLQ